MYRTGDVVLVDGGRHLLSWAIKVIMSRGRDERRSFTSHNGMVVEKNGAPWIINAQPPYATMEPLADYLAKVEASGGRWAIARPWDIAQLDNLKPAAVAKKRRWMEYDAELMVGHMYPKADLWVIFKRLTKLDRVFPWIKAQKQLHYCVELVRALLASDHGGKCDVVWQPAEWINETLPAPIHTERIAGRGGFILQQASDGTFWREICTGRKVVPLDA